MKTILLLGAGFEQLAAINMARALGYRSVAMDRNPHAPGLAAADKGYARDFADENAVWETAHAENVAGIFAHAVEMAEVVANVCRGLGLPGIDPAVSRRCTDKLERAKCLTEAGVPYPRYEFAERADELEKAIARLGGLPLIFKPLRKAGARGVSVADTISDARRAFMEAASFGGPVIIEELIIGHEISTEHVVYGEAIYTTGFADRNYDRKRFAPYVIEDGHTIPSTLDDEMQRKVIAVAESAIRALGIDRGPAKGDLTVTPSGRIVVFEMACRTSGGRFCSDMVPLATGVAILKPLIQMAVGDPVDTADLAPKFQRAAAQRFFWPRPGVVTRITSMNSPNTAGCEGIHDVVIDLVVGDTVHRPRCHADRVGHVIASAKTRQDAIDRAERAVERVRIETAKVNAGRVDSQTSTV